MRSTCARAPRVLLALLCLVLSIAAAGCGGGERPLLPRSQTWAELRTVRRAVTVKVPGEGERPPYPRERLVDGEEVQVSAAGLAWLRRDGGATLLVRGPARLTVRADGIELAEGRVFVDTPAGVVEELTTPSGPLHLANVRASVDVSDVSGAHEATDVYVLAGEVRTDGAGGEPASRGTRATAGERLLVRGKAGAAKAETSPALSWEDWTGGLATTDRAAEPAPYGVGTVGARRPGDQGSPRFPLAIQKLDVRVTIDGDFAVTEVDEIFFNPTADAVEGIYRFRTPEGATLHRFGVDRDGVVIWGRVKEKAAAAAQYQANVYAGSTEDPALLEWDAPGVYKARLYPIEPGATRRVVVRYAEWLSRTGAKGERRLYVYPMAAEGSAGSAPIIEELTARLDLARAAAREVRVGMEGVRDGGALIVRAQDFTPRADLAVELFDDGLTSLQGVSARHVVDLEVLPPEERGAAQRQAGGEPDYVLVPVRADDVPLPQGGLDLAIVVDTSAATGTADLAIARAATAALLAHLGPEDRVAIWAGDSRLRPAAPGADRLASVDEVRRRELLRSLSAVERGGATDLGAMLAEAAAALDPARRGAVVYIGDGSPTVGELDLADLRARLAKLPRPVRIFGLGVGDGADMAILKGLARGAIAERIGDAGSAARAALRLLERAERPAWLGARIDLGPDVERVFPRDLGAIVADESAVVVGRLTGRRRPTSVSLAGPAGERTLPLKVTPMSDVGDLRRRWAEGRLAQMLEEAVGRAAMVDLGSRYGIITPVTSLYVPTRREMSGQELTELSRRREEQKQKAQAAGTHRQSTATSTTARAGNKKGMKEAEGEDGAWGRDDSLSDDKEEGTNKEGGTGTRAKGEEGSMGMRPSASASIAAPSQAAATAPAPTSEPVMAQAYATAAAEAPPPPPAFPAAGSTAMPERKPVEAGKPDTSEVANARARALRDAQEFGMIGLLTPTTEGGAEKGGAEKGGARSNEEVNQPPADMNGWMDVPPTSETGILVDGLALSGVGEGGGGRADTTTLDPGQAKAGDELGRGRLGGHARSGAHGDLDERLAKNIEQRVVPFSGRGVGPTVVVRLGDVPHAAFRCGGAALAPLEERTGLWRERLGRVAGNAHAMAAVYRQALAACEAPTFRERAKLLSMMLDAAPAVAARVALWRVMFQDLGAADTLYRGILARVRTPQEMRALQQALGLKRVDPGLLEKTLAEARTPAARAAKLRGLHAVWPDDFGLALLLLDALEDAGDDAGARELGRALRARPDADAALRTAVGELYLRLAARAAAPAQRALDEAEARRAFGEIVEFSPDDPAARRRLGDLLRAHGWYAEAARQYETLARLTPDDPSVALLLAAAAEGLGKLEEAVKWTEKGGAAGDPEVLESPAHTARALAATYLGWGRLAAREGGRDEEVKALAARLVRVRAGEGSAGLPPGGGPRGTRVTLTWAHPELHPTLWSNALNAPMPAPEGDITLGIAQVMLPEREGREVEVRLDPDAVEHAARLGAEATLTVIFDEAGEGEKIVRRAVRFARGDAAVKRFAIRAGDVREVSP